MSVLLLGLVFAPSSVFQQLFSALGLSAGVARDTAAGLDTESGAEVNSEGTGDEDASQEDSSVNVREISIIIWVECYMLESPKKLFLIPGKLNLYLTD